MIVGKKPKVKDENVFVGEDCSRGYAVVGTGKTRTRNRIRGRFANFARMKFEGESDGVANAKVGIVAVLNDPRTDANVK